MSWKFLETKTGEKVKVDADIFDKVNQKSWRVIYRGKDQKPSVVTSIRKGASTRTMTLGQFIMKPKTGFMVYPRRWQAGLDYRRDNLVVCSMKERQRMLPKRVYKSSSRYKGVSFVKGKNLWRARIEKNGKSMYIGDFKSESEAALAYNNTALQVFGNNAYQNQISRKPERRK